MTLSGGVPEAVEGFHAGGRAVCAERSPGLGQAARACCWGAFGTLHDGPHEKVSRPESLPGRSRAILSDAALNFHRAVTGFAGGGIATSAQPRSPFRLFGRRLLCGHGSRGRRTPPRFAGHPTPPGTDRTGTRILDRSERTLTEPCPALLHTPGPEEIKLLSATCSNAGRSHPIIINAACQPALRWNVP